MRESSTVSGRPGAKMIAPSTDKPHQSIILRDDRRLGFAEFGTPDGQPVLYFHGWPGSRLEARAASGISEQLGIRLVALDRPGYGLSDYQPGRTIASWPDDVAQVAAQLQIAQFAVLGVSGGGPFAAVCAAGMADQISVALIVCGIGPLEAPGVTQGMSPWNRWLLRMARHAPRVTRAIGGFFLMRLFGTAGAFLPAGMEATLPECDRSALACADFRRALTSSATEAFRQGPRGALWDGCLYARTYGFKLEDIHTPVRLWHGELDTIVPPASGRHYARAIPGCRASFSPGEGHFSLPFNRMREILTQALP